MRRILAIVLFATAAAAVTAMSAGVAAPPHRMPPGTPLVHTLVFSAYRYAFLLEPIREQQTLTPEMAILHKALALAGIPMPDMPGMDSSAADPSLPVLSTGGLLPAADLALALALLVFVVPRLPRPGRAFIGELAVAPLSQAQWRAHSPDAPPRSLALAF